MVGQGFGAQVQSLTGKLRSHMHKGAAEKIFEKEVVRESNGDRFIAYIKRK